MKDQGKCKVLCTKDYNLNNRNDKKKVRDLKKGMSMNYQHHWIIDNMPVSIQGVPGSISTFCWLIT